jgi:hypothetical protein
MAAFIVFGIHPGGFEGQVAWFFLLFPGAFPAIVLSDGAYKLAPSAVPFAYWTLLISFNFCWYWGISFILIKILRRAGPKSWEGF